MKKKKPENYKELNKNKNIKYKSNKNM